MSMIGFVYCTKEEYLNQIEATKNKINTPNEESSETIEKDDK